MSRKKSLEPPSSIKKVENVIKMTQSEEKETNNIIDAISSKTVFAGLKKDLEIISKSNEKN